MKTLHHLFVIALILALASCTSYKTIPYFSDIPPVNDSSIVENPYTDPVIQHNDILLIAISSMNPEATQMFNFAGQGAAGGGGGGTGVTAGSSYMVDPLGLIKLPLIGPVRVVDLTTWQVRDTITKLLVPYLMDPLVEIRISSFKVTVLGEVGSPGPISITNERLTLLDALSMAGDLKISSRRDNVLLIREEKGLRRQIRFNLNNRETLNSPYFYLRSNDVVYVQPNKNPTRDVNFRNITYLLTAVSLITVINSLLTSFRNN